MSTLDKLVRRWGLAYGWPPRLRVAAVVRLASAGALSCALLWGSSAAAAPRAEDQVGDQTAAERGVEVRELPDVSMASGVLVTSDGRVLWARQPGDERAMASITKVMTALVALERAELDEPVRVTAESSEPGESVAGLTAGDTLPMSSLLEALLVKSGNDAAVVVAEHVGGDEDAFVELMNEKAAALGMDKTRFANPHGLDEEDHYSSAADLSVLVREAMKDPEFRRIVALESVRLDGQTFENSNKLIGSYPGATGVKTGWTGDAGYSLAASASRGGVQLVAVVLGTANESVRFSEARTLLDWGFEHYAPVLLGSEGVYAGAVPVSDFLDVDVGALIGEETSATVFDLEGAIEEDVVLDESVDAPVRRGQAIGTVTYRQGDRELATVGLVASRDVEAPGLLTRIGIAATRVWRGVFGEPESSVPPPAVPQS